MADSLVMMALGDFRFGLSTAAYQQLERTSSWLWPAVPRIGALPRRQFIGPDDDGITLDGSIYPSFRGGLGQVDAMRVEANKGEPLLLVDGLGKVWGDFCITEIRETQQIFFSNGQPRRIDFSVTLAISGDKNV